VEGDWRLEIRDQRLELEIGGWWIVVSEEQMARVRVPDSTHFISCEAMGNKIVLAGKLRVTESGMCVI